MHVSKPADRPRGKVWRILLEQRLPTIPIPLRAPDPDQPLELQAILERSYERGAYDLSIDYRSEPVPPLEGEKRGWADGVLRAMGAR